MEQVKKEEIENVDPGTSPSASPSPSKKSKSEEKSSVKSIADYLNDKGFSGYYLRGQQANLNHLESSSNNNKHAIFKGQKDAYPENVIIVGPTVTGKSTLARDLLRLGKYPEAEMLFIVQKREASPSQIKTWQEIINSHKNKIDAFQIVIVDTVSELDSIIQRVINFLSEKFGIQNSDERLLKTIVLLDDLSQECLKSTQYVSLCSSGSHNGVGSITVFHSIPLRPSQSWSSLVSHYKLYIAFDNSPEIEKMFKNEFPSTSRLRHPLSDILTKETSNPHGHVAVFKKNVSHARLRTNLTSKEQLVYIPVDGNGDMDYGYERMSVNKTIVRFQPFAYAKTPRSLNVYFLKTASNQNVSNQVESTENEFERRCVEVKEKGEKKAEQISSKVPSVAERAEELLNKRFRKKRYGIESSDSEESISTSSDNDTDTDLTDY